ncbi:unnamed protein product [Callosobruchus maculatus]|uniref:Regulatory protein zeste n=1 Tax=Callosobruchus maculatus TaxID=64391 RepID=A0A653D907_CALMS|nr:unnamed protein product [Callosobruchus maculatus]
MSGKKRSSNFSSREESLLVSLVKKYAHIIECKSSDTMTHQQKHECWEDVEREFNSNSGEVFRTKDVLRKKYDNIKKNVKKKYSDEKCYSQGTGGGPPRKETFTNIENEIKEILGTRIEGLPSEFDGDAPEGMNLQIYYYVKVKKPMMFSAPASSSKAKVSDDILEDLDNCNTVVFDNGHYKENLADVGMQVSHNASVEQYAKDAPNTSTTNVPGVYKQWTVGTPKMLKSKKSLVLDTSKSKRCKGEIITDKISQWAAAKHVVEDHRKKFLEEEQKFKLQVLREKHEQELELFQQKAKLEMKILEDEHRAKMKFLEDEHKMKMEILLLQRNRFK